MNEEIKCDICGKTGFKSKAGLAGHKKISHGEDRRKTVPDEIGKRLDEIKDTTDKLILAIEYLGSFAHAFSAIGGKGVKKEADWIFDRMEQQTGIKIYRGKKENSK